MFLKPAQMAHYFRDGVMTLSAALVMLSSPVFAQGTAEEILFTPALTFSGDVHEFEISPDGTQVVMIAVMENPGGGTLGQQTFVAGLLGGSVLNPTTRVVPDNAGDNDGGVRWTPDGLSVVTRYDISGNNAVNEVYLSKADGSDSQTPQQLTFNSNNAFDPQISADGLSLFYSDDTGGGPAKLYVTPIATASDSSSILLSGGDFSELDTGTYAQVGSDIVYSGFSTAMPGAGNGTREDAFYRTAADGSTAATPTLIPITNFPTADPDLNFGRMAVTSDGQTIVFQGDMTTDGQTELYSMPIAGGDYVSLIGGTIRPDFDVNFFKLSHDGKTIAFVSDYLTNGTGEAYIMPITGGVPTRVSNPLSDPFDVAFTGAPDRLQFSPDDSKLYYVSDDGHDGRFGLFRVAIAAPVLLGDVNLDSVVDFLDISPFIAILSGSTFQAEADCDESGAVDFLDISPFIAILSGS